MRIMPKRLRLLAWNVKVGRAPRAVIRALGLMIMIRRPHLIVLNEAAGYVDELRDAFVDRYRIRRTRDVVVLIRRNLPRPEIERIGHDIKWVGPHLGKPHQGRRFLIIRFPGLTVVALHRTPGGPRGGTSAAVAGKNRRAWRAEDALIEDVFDDADARNQAARLDHREIELEAVYAVGDQNATPREMVPHVARVNAVLATPPKTHVDYGYGRDLHADVERLGRHGSDHPATLHTLTTGVAA